MTHKINHSTPARVSGETTVLPLSAKNLLDRYNGVRSFTDAFCEPLATEDYVIQSMPDVSPTKWHLAHTTWFFETFILKEAMPGYNALNENYHYLFNSYYVAAGQRHCRPKRGLLSRPTVEEVRDYREHVNRHMTNFLQSLDGEGLEVWGPLVEVGLNHEQQHQELMVTDLKHNFSINPLHPAYKQRKHKHDGGVVPFRWVDFEEGVYWVGNDGMGYSFDNESPRHRVFLEPFRLASRLVTNREYLEFIESDGYKRADLWLSAGWDTVQNEEWTSPLYWEKRDDGWWVMTLYGMEKVNPDEPVCHVSYYEADAFSRWAGARLPTEAEWEVATSDIPIVGNFAENGIYHPLPVIENEDSGALSQMYGDVWEWTQSHYSPYPGYKPPPGALGEYNGKFMANQFVLRGGSCATSASHIRPTYRNFFHPDSSWQFSGFRLAKTISV